MFAVGSSSEIRDNPYVKVALKMTKPYTLRMLLLLRVFVLRCWAGWVVVLDLTPKKRAKNSVSKKTNANKTSFKPALTHC